MDAAKQWCFEVLTDLSSSELKDVFTGFFTEGDEGDVMAKELIKTVQSQEMKANFRNN